MMMVMAFVVDEGEAVVVEEETRMGVVDVATMEDILMAVVDKEDDRMFHRINSNSRQNCNRQNCSNRQSNSNRQNSRQ
jgi:hypothetical protein